jgi:hypothetical protein
MKVIFLGGPRDGYELEITRLDMFINFPAKISTPQTLQKGDANKTTPMHVYKLKEYRCKCGDRKQFYVYHCLENA